MVQSIEAARRRPGAPAGARIPPHNIDAEKSLLGAMLLSRDAIAAAMETCSADDFYKPAHSHVFEAINTLYNRGEPADPVTVADELGRAGLSDSIGGLAALVTLQADTPATTNAARYARIIEEHALLRRLISVAGEIAEMGYSVPEDVVAAMDRAETLVFNVAERRVTDSLKALPELLTASMDRLERLYDQGQSITGVPTGYVDLDEKLYGLQPSSLVIVGARPAMGKCLRAGTRVLDADTGAMVRGGGPVPAVLRPPHRAVSSFRVLSLGEDRRLTPVPVSAWIDDGVKPVFRVRTRLGRDISTTASHPFLTVTGWRPLVDLDGDPELHVGVQLHRYLVGAEALDRLIEAQPASINGDLGLLGYRFGHVTRGDGTEQFGVAARPGPSRDLDHHGDQGAGHQLGRLAVLGVPQIAGPTHGIGLGGHPARGGYGVALGKQVVAGVSVRNVDDVATLAHVVEIGAEDDPHQTSASSRSVSSCVSSSPSSRSSISARPGISAKGTSPSARVVSAPSPPRGPRGPRPGPRSLTVRWV